MMSMTGRFRGWAMRAWLVAAFAAAVPAHAADALNGKMLYLTGPAGGARSCAMCHTPSPTANVKNTLNAANNPARIAYAIGANLGNMGVLYTGRFTSADLADMAAFIADPNVAGNAFASLQPASLAFPATAVGQSAATLSTTLTNISNANLNVSSLSTTGAGAADYGFGTGCSLFLQPGESCTFDLGFQPTATGTRTAALVLGYAVGSDFSDSSSLALSGTGTPGAQATVGLSSTAIDFGTLAPGVGATRTVTVSNSGQAPLTFSGLTLGGTDAGAFTLGGSCSTGIAVPAGGSCTVSITAAPGGTAAFSGSLTLASTASNGTVTVALGGMVEAAAPALAASPASVAFGTRAVGGSSSQVVTLANTGNVPITFGALAVAGDAAFTLAGRTCGSTLAAGSTCTVTVAYSPVAQAAGAATLTVPSNAVSLQVSLAGSGTAAPVGQPTLADAGPLAFADTQVGRTSSARMLAFGNSGTAAWTVAAVSISGAQATEFVAGGTCVAGASVAPGASCTLDLAFRPTAAGARSATATLVTGDGASYAVLLTATGLVVAAPAGNLQAQESGGGGCSAARGSADPVLALLLVLAAGVLSWRRASCATCRRETLADH